jgi:hypothetical protein
MKSFLRRRWLTIVIVVVIVAAAATAAFLLLGRTTSTGTHYLTAKATVGTIADTVQSDFTLSDASDAATISLSGTGSASSGSSSTGAASTSAAGSGGTHTITTVSAAAGSPTILTAAVQTSDTASPTPSASPTVTGLAPPKGPVGATVTLSGSGFDGTSAVAFDGRPAFYQVLSDTQLRTIVPAHATSGPITVTTSVGTATSSMPFRVTATPKPRPTPTRTSSPSSGSTSRSSSYAGGSSLTSSSSSSAGSSGASSSSSSLGVVTSIALVAGVQPHTLQRLLSVSGSPIFAFVSTTPLYQTLSTSLSAGSDRSNVATLQRALKAAGYFSGAVDGDFGSSTQTALEDWQGAHGLSKTGEVTTSVFAWVPKGAVIESWNVVVGAPVSSSTAFATVDFPRDLVVEAQVSQSALASLKVGQTAACTIDGLTNGSFDAKIVSISTQPASSSSAGSSSSAAQYTVDLTPKSLPSLARSGMTGSLTVTIASRSNVLVVPTSAVSGTSAASFVRVMQNGVPVYREVTTGLATSSLTQITSGLVSGEVVVTGTYTNSASSVTSSSGGFGGLGGFGGGGFFRRSSGGSGSSSGSSSGGGG